MLDDVINGMYLQYPEFLLLVLVFMICAYFCKIRLSSIYFPHAQQFMKKSISTSKLQSFLKWLAIVSLIIALASPVKDEPYELEPKDGYEIALILDASESMQAQGFDSSNRSLTRFDVVKNIVEDFVKQREMDNMGLVVFGEYSFIASPLTYDKNILSRIVSQLQIGMAGKFTALYEALAQGVNLLNMSESKTKIAILLTDGHSTVGVDKIPLDVAIDMANKEGVKVYPIGIGGPNEYNRKVLVDIAQKTGGVAFGASSATQLLEVYKKIDELEKSEIKTETFSYINYYFLYPLVLGFISLMLYIFLRNKRAQA